MLVLLIAFGAWLSPTKAQTYTIGNGSTTITTAPYYGLYSMSYGQTLYLGSDLQAAGWAGGGGLITKIGFNLSTVPSTPTSSNGWTIYLGNTTATTVTAGPTNFTPTSQLTQVFTGTVNLTATGWIMVDLATPFVYDGDNLWVCVYENAPSWSGCTWKGQTMSGTVARTLYSDTYDPIPGSLPGPYSGTSTSTTIRPDLRLELLPACTSTPGAGTISSPVYACMGNSVTLSPTGGTVAAGLEYLWEESSDGSTWAAATGANDEATYTTPAFTGPMYYRLTVTCTNGGQPATTNAVQVLELTTPPYYTYDGANYSESFENWVNGCVTGDLPSFNWLNNPSTGNNSWRRNDQGASAGWGAPNSGMYTPAATDGSYSARFHSVEAGTDVGELDFYVDLSNNSGNSRLRFDYINPTSQTDRLRVHISTDGGANFTPMAAALGQQNEWTTVEYDLTATSATTIIRFRATAVNGDKDMGIDNFRIFEPCSGEPTAATATATPATVCAGGTSTITSDATTDGGIVLQWEQSNDGMTGWTPIAGANGPNYTTEPLSFIRYYRVARICTYSSEIAYSNVVSVGQTLPTYAVYDGTLFSESFETWNDLCGTTDAPDFWRTVPATGNNSWRRNDQGASATWTSATTGAYTPTSTAGTYSARFHSSYISPAGTAGDLELFIDMSAATGPTRMTFDVINTSGTDKLQVFFSDDGGENFDQIGSDILFDASGWKSQKFDFISTSATTVIRLRGVSDYAATDIGVDNFKLEPAPSCLEPTGLGLADVDLPNATFSWTASLSSPSQGYEWELYEVVGGTETLVDNGSTAAGETSATSSVLLEDKDYVLKVRANCGGGDLSEWAEHSFHTGYCVVTSTSTSYGISNFTTTGGYTNINNSSGPGSYSNYTDQSVSASPGDVVNFTITSYSGTVGMGIWIDWNKDYEFDASEQVYASGTYVDPGTGSITVPSGQPFGSYRMRVVANWLTTTPTPCGDLGYQGYGEAEDYTFVVTAPPLCPAPTNLFANNITTSSADLSWWSVGDAGDGYEWEVHGVGSNPTNQNDRVDFGSTATLSDTTASTAVLQPNTTYRLYVRSNCGTGFSDWAGPYTFFTGYCQVTSTSTTYGISNFTTTGGYTNINNTSGGGSYSDYTSMVVSASAGDVIGFTITSANSTAGMAIWVDWNNNLEFEATERMYNAGSYLSQGTGSFTVPSGQPNGSYRIRVVANYLSTNPTPCGDLGSQAYGEAEDYTFVVSAPPSCMVPTGLTAANIGQNSADYSWTAPATGDTPQGYFWEVRTSGIPGSGSAGLAADGYATGTTASSSTLSPSTTYKLYVQSDCDDAQSFWAGPYTFNTLCGTIVAPFTETFDAALATPNCWTNTATGSTLWLFGASGGSGPGYGVQGAVDHTSGTGNFAWFDGSYNTSIPTLTTPQIDVSALAAPMVRLWVLANNTDDAAQNTLKVQAFDGSAWVEIGSMSGNDPNWRKLDMPLPGGFPTTTQVRMTIIAATSGSAFYHDILIDDFTVMEAPDCTPPSGLSVVSLTETDGTFSWNASGSNPDGYEWEIRTSGAPGSGNSGLTDSGSETGTTASTSLLTADTDYNLYVRSDCGEDGFSDWSAALSFRTGYCIPVGTGSSYYIANVSTTGAWANLDNTTGYSANGYGDYTSQQLVASAGQTISFSLTAGSASTYAWSIWVDWNNDFDFGGTGEQVYTTGTSYVSNPATASLTIPGSVPDGTYRIRIRNAWLSAPAQACGTSAYGEAEDYTLVIGPEPDCVPPTDLMVTSLSTTDGSFSWTGPANGVSYNWEVRSSGAPGSGATGRVDFGTATGTSASATGFSADNTYTLYVQSDCGGDGLSSWASISFYTGYCIPTGAANNSDEILNFTLADLSNSSSPSEGTSGYSNYTGTVAPANLEAGLSYTASLTSGSGTGNHGAAIWIDWNNNLEFEASEMVTFLPNSIPASSTATFPAFAVPNAPGTHRLRVAYRYSIAGNLLDPCVAGSTFSEYEDYLVNVTLPPCALPAGIAVNNLTGTSGELTWTDGGADSYNWELRTSGAPGSGNPGLEADGNVASGTPPVALTLDPNTTYTVYVQSVCGTETSTWASVSFTTPCATYMAPYLETFDDGLSTPACWTNTATGTTLWLFGASGGTGPGYGVQGAVDHTTGSGNFTWFDGSFATSIPTLTTPVIDMSSLTVPMVRLWMLANNVDDAAQNTLKVQAYDGSTWVEIGSFSGNDPNWRKQEMLLPPGIPSITQFRLTIVASTVGSAFYHDILVDDFQVMEAPACTAPTGLTVSNMTETSADFSWTASSSNPDEYEWEVREAGTAPGDPSGFVDGGTTTGTTASTSLLATDSNYRLYVRSNCGATGYSEWAGPKNFHTGYCEVTSTSTTYGISNFTTTGGYTNINNSSSGGSYSDYTSMVVSASAGDVIGFSITSASSTAGMAIWIDWNNNLEFEATERMYNAGTYVSTGSGSFTVPSGQPNGSYRMRVVANYLSTNPTPCGDLGSQAYGEAEDYTVTVMAPPSCLSPSGLTVSNLSTTHADFSWTASTTSPEGYDWEIRTSGAPGSGNPGLVDSGSTDATETSGSSDELAAETHYTLYVRADCGNGDLSLWVSIEFFNGYCEPVGTSTTYHIAYVGTSGAWVDLDNSTGLSAGGYGNYTNQTLVASTGQTINYTLIGGPSGYTYMWGIWVDWNNDLDFNDPGEQIYLSSTYEAATFTGSFTIPAVIPDGSYRMRIRQAYISPAPTPCGTSIYGEAEDYTLVIGPEPDCMPPTDLMVTSLTTTDGTFSWTGPTNGVGYNWEVRSNGEPGSGGAGLVSSGNTAGTTASTTGLSANTTYYLYVQSDCGVDGTSYWSSISFYTGYCIPTGAANNSDEIRGFSLADLNNTSGASEGTNGYSDYTGTVAPANLLAGVSYVASLTSGAGSGNHGAAIWIDWNDNLDFEASEMVAWLPNSIAANTTVNFPAFAVPNAPGTHRLRVAYRYSISGDQIDPCSTTSTFTEYEDYLVDVTIPTCPPPFDLAVDNLGTNSATFSWTLGDPAPSGGYNWEVRTSGAGGSGNTGLVDFGNTTGNSVTVTGLNSSTQYTIYVQADCGGGDMSVWASASFTTGAACGDPFYDTGGPTGNYGLSENWVKTYCASNPGDQVRVLFNSFYTEANWDKLFIFNGPDTNSPKFDSGMGAGSGNTDYGAGGWSGNLNDNLPGPFTSSNPTGCLTFAFVSDASVAYAGWEAITQCVETNSSCANAFEVLCGGNYPGSTAGITHNMPTNGCAFNGPASTGGQNWWMFEATSTDAITFSTCSNAGFDTRISVFTGTDCGDLECVAMNDDSPGCANGGSSVTINGVPGTFYWIAVHGAGAEEGSYTLSVNCGAGCTPPANDNCVDAEPLANNLLDGSNTPDTYTNECAMVDGPTACSGANPVMGVWFTFNSGDYNHARLTLLDNNEDGQYTATSLDYALFTGGCAGITGSGSVACVEDGAGVIMLDVDPNTEYHLLVYNNGGAGLAGTFGIMVEHPAHNDAAITAILDPAEPGQMCGSTMSPVVTLMNNGDNNLTSVDIVYGLSGGTTHTYSWTGNLAYGQSEIVTLPTVPAEAGNGQTFTASVSMPNGEMDEITANDSQSISGLDVGGEGLHVIIHTNNNPSASFSWSLWSENFSVFEFGGPYDNQPNTTIDEFLCLSTDDGNQFHFSLSDAEGNGLCCGDGEGYWELRAADGGLLLRDIFDANIDGYSSPIYPGQSPAYGFGHSFNLPAGPVDIHPGECGIMDNHVDNKVYAVKQAGKNYQNATLNYQFEFANPDSGRIRRIAVPRNYVIFSEMAGLKPLVPDVTYFARVRTDKSGPLTEAYWGTGCEMALESQDICTQLIDDVGNPYHSCGVIRKFKKGNWLIAEPVYGAQQYEFRVYIPGEYEQTFLRNNYKLELGWAANQAPGLVNGSTYHVQVRVKVNNVWGNYCGDCTVTIDNSYQGSMVQAFGEATLWPNPVRDGQVNLNIDGIASDVQHITVDIKDIYGQHVYGQEFENFGERFNTVLNLPGDIASGVYMVDITINGEVTTKRLSIVR